MRNTGGTDHLSFDAVGIPGFQFIQDPLDYESRTHHSNEDVNERLQAADLKQISTVEAVLFFNAAQRDDMLPRKPLPHPDKEQQRLAPSPDIFPGAVPPAEKDSGPKRRNRQPRNRPGPCVRNSIAPHGPDPPRSPSLPSILVH